MLLLAPWAILALFFIAEKSRSRIETVLVLAVPVTLAIGPREVVVQNGQYLSHFADTTLLLIGIESGLLLAYQIFMEGREAVSVPVKKNVQPHKEQEKQAVPAPKVSANTQPPARPIVKADPPKAETSGAARPVEPAPKALPAGNGNGGVPKAIARSGVADDLKLARTAEGKELLEKYWKVLMRYYRDELQTKLVEIGVNPDFKVDDEAKFKTLITSKDFFPGVVKLIEDAQRNGDKPNGGKPVEIAKVTQTVTAVPPAPRNYKKASLEDLVVWAADKDGSALEEIAGILKKMPSDVDVIALIAEHFTAALHGADLLNLAVLLRQHRNQAAVYALLEIVDKETKEVA